MQQILDPSYKIEIIYSDHQTSVFLRKKWGRYVYDFCANAANVNDGPVVRLTILSPPAVKFNVGPPVAYVEFRYYENCLMLLTMHDVRTGLVNSCGHEQGFNFLQSAHRRSWSMLWASLEGSQSEEDEDETLEETLEVSASDIFSSEAEHFDYGIVY